MKSSNVKAFIIVPLLLMVVAGGLLTPTTSCTCDSDPLREFLVYLHVAVMQELPDYSSLHMSREAVLEVVPLGTTKEELLRINSEIRGKNGGGRVTSLCNWSSQGDVFQCELQAGRSWFDVVQQNVTVRFEFGRALRLDQVLVTERESIFGRETVREI
jgi:hypothetical protein